MIAHSHASRAADLKSLHDPAASSFRDFKSISGTGSKLLASAPLLPKFVPEGAAMYHELRKRGARGLLTIDGYRFRQFNQSGLEMGSLPQATVDRRPGRA